MGITGFRRTAEVTLAEVVCQNDHAIGSVCGSEAGGVEEIGGRKNELRKERGAAHGE